MTGEACVFCDIIKQREVAHVAWADEHVVAFLDRVPLFKGHVLVVPRTHVVNLEDLAPETIEPLFARVQLVSAAMTAELGAAGSFVAMNNTVSQSVPHLHVHVVPRNPKDGLRGFFWPRTKYESAEEMAEMAARLHDWLEPRMVELGAASSG